MKSRFRTNEESLEDLLNDQSSKSLQKPNKSTRRATLTADSFLSPVSLSGRKKSRSKHTAVDDQFDYFSQTNSYGPSNDGSIIDEQVQNHYYSIVEITTQENENLKQQNSFLLEQLKKMKIREQKMHAVYNKAKEYKAMYLDSLEQIEILKQECEVYKQQAEQMKEIALRDLCALREKVNMEGRHNQENLYKEECSEQEENQQKGDNQQECNQFQ